MDDEFDLAPIGLPAALRDPRGAIRRRWPWMLLVVTLGLAATGVFVALQPPRYAAEAAILVATQQIPESFVRSTVGEDSLQRINAMIGEVLSREKLAQLIRKRGLYAELEDSETLGSRVDRMRENISINAAPGVGPAHRQSARVFTIRFESEQPDLAAVIANDLAGLFTDESIRMRSQQARMTTEFLSRELDRAERKLREQNARITEFRERHRGELPSDLRGNLGRLERLQQQRQSLTFQIVQAENRIAMLSSHLIESGGGDGSPEARLVALRAQLRAAQGIYTEHHPSIVSLRRQIAALEAELAAMPPPTADSRGAPMLIARRTLAELQSQLERTQRMIDVFDERVSRTPAREEELAALEEEEMVLRENYLGFLRKVQEAELAQNLESAQQGERFSVLDRAEPPTAPTKARWRYLCVGVAASLLAAAGFGVLLEALDLVLVSADQVEAASKLPILGSVSRIG